MFAHMHHVMANNALIKIGCEAKTDQEYWNPNKSRLREIVISGSVDFDKSVTVEDRETVLRYLNA